MKKPTKISKKLISQLFPKRKADVNKGDFGHVLIIGGDFGMAGAVMMAGEAAARSGAGRVTVLTRKEHFTPLLARMPNLMTADFESKNDWHKIIKNKTVIVIGPGLGLQSDWSQMLFGLAMESNLPKVIDADALNLLAKSNLEGLNLTNSVITPHPGEAARLLNSTTEEIQKNRIATIKKLQEKYQTNVILKGHHSLILDQNQNLHLCPYGNPGMATAGMGDVLSGVIAALIAQNLKPEIAARLGTLIHALGGDQASKENGPIGIIPTDLINQIPKIINQ